MEAHEAPTQHMWCLLYARTVLRLGTQEHRQGLPVFRVHVIGMEGTYG